MPDRVVLGSENDDSKKLDLQTLGTKVIVPMALYNSSGTQITNFTGGFQIDNYDYIGVSYPDSVTEIYTYKSGGSSGTTVSTLTVVYSSSSKLVLTSVTKT